MNTCNEGSFHEASEEITNLAQIVKIQAMVRGFLTRCEIVSKTRASVLFNDRVESQGRKWFCKLIKFRESGEYSLTVRLLANPQKYQKIKHFAQIPFADHEAHTKLT